MTDYGSLLKALEGYGYCGECASPVDEAGASVVEKVLPLTRQLVKEYKANEQNCAMSHVDESIYDALRKENERLKASAEGHAQCERNMDAEVERLQTRLSLAEQESKWYREDRDNFQMKFSAAETRLAENRREDGVERWRGEAELYMRLYGEQREENERLGGVISLCDKEIDELHAEVLDLRDERRLLSERAKHFAKENERLIKQIDKRRVLSDKYDEHVAELEARLSAAEAVIAEGDVTPK